jgi:hypothetical protein
MYQHIGKMDNIAVLWGWIAVLGLAGSIITKKGKKKTRKILVLDPDEYTCFAGFMCFAIFY